MKIFHLSSQRETHTMRLYILSVTTITDYVLFLPKGFGNKEKLNKKERDAYNASLHFVCNNYY
jgi:hypothetical protein